MTSPNQIEGNAANAELLAYQRKSLRGLRGIGAAILILEALVVALAIPVLLKQGHGGTTWRHIAVAAVIAISVLLVVAAAELRRPWGPRFATVMQGLGLIAGASSFALLFLMVRVHRDLGLLAVDAPWPHPGAGRRTG